MLVYVTMGGVRAIIIRLIELYISFIILVMCVVSSHHVHVVLFKVLLNLINNLFNRLFQSMCVRVHEIV